jgi:hypothetical protein
MATLLTPNVVRSQDLKSILRGYRIETGIKLKDPCCLNTAQFISSSLDFSQVIGIFMKSRCEAYVFFIDAIESIFFIIHGIPFDPRYIQKKSLSPSLFKKVKERR